MTPKEAKELLRKINRAIRIRDRQTLIKMSSQFGIIFRVWALDLAGRRPGGSIVIFQGSEVYRIYNMLYLYHMFDLCHLFISAWPYEWRHTDLLQLMDHAAAEYRDT
jgi:hypothetical protein